MSPESEPEITPDAPVDRVADTLTTIWSRVLYGTGQSGSADDP